MFNPMLTFYSDHVKHSVPGHLHFEGNNYIQWVDEMLSWLEANGLTYVIEDACPSSVTNKGVVLNQEAINSWKHNDSKAKGSIKLCLVPYVKSSIPKDDLNTTKSLMEYLKKPLRRLRSQSSSRQ